MFHSLVMNIINLPNMSDESLYSISPIMETVSGEYAITIDFYPWWLKQITIKQKVAYFFTLYSNQSNLSKF